MAIVFSPHVPTANFAEHKHNIKFYTGAVGDDIGRVMDLDAFAALPVHSVLQPLAAQKKIFLMRHLESKYNEYKDYIKGTDIYKSFVLAEDPTIKQQLAMDLLADFRKHIGVDYTTPISEKGHQQGAEISKNYASLIHDNPSLFPDLFLVSPYLRTRQTAHYLLRDVQGLDLDTDMLVDDNDTRDMIVGSFHGKDIVLKFSEAIRERDHGAMVAPSFLRDYFTSLDPVKSLLELSKEEDDMLYYYTAPDGGESQMQVNERTAQALHRALDSQYNNIFMVSHHLVILAALRKVFSGTHRTFQSFDTYRKPRNGSISLLVQVPKTETGQENKLRAAFYNTQLLDT